MKFISDLAMMSLVQHDLFLAVSHACRYLGLYSCSLSVYQQTLTMFRTMLVCIRL